MAWTAAIAMLLFAWPRFFGQTINLLETGLLLLLYLLTIGLLLRPGHRGAAGKAALGILLGLAALARLDTVFLLIAIAIIGTIRRPGGRDLIEDGRTGAGLAWDSSLVSRRICGRFF